MKLSSLLLGAILLPALPAQSAVILSDDFESYTVGNVPTTGASWVLASNAATANVRVANQSISTAFGTTNQFVNFNDANSNASGGTNTLRSNTFTAASDVLTTLSFDFFEPTTGGSGGMIVGYAIDALDIGSSANQRLAVTLDDGVISGVTAAATGSNTYTVGAAYRMFMVFNDTVSAVVYGGGTVAANSAQIWLRNSGGIYTLVGSRASQNTGTTEASYNVAFRSSSPDVQNVYLDNVVLETGAATAIPEPSAALLGGLGMLALLRRRHR